MKGKIKTEAMTAQHESDHLSWRSSVGRVPRLLGEEPYGYEHRYYLWYDIIVALSFSASSLVGTVLLMSFYTSKLISLQASLQSYMLLFFFSTSFWSCIWEWHGAWECAITMLRILAIFYMTVIPYNILYCMHVCTAYVGLAHAGSPQLQIT